MRARTTSVYWVLAVLGLATVYFAAAKLGLLLAVAAEQVSPVWPPTGIALAAVLLFGYRIWPAITLGAFLANVTAHEPLPTACGIALGNTLEAIVGAWLMQRFLGTDISFERLQDVLGLLALSAGLSTVISATLGVASLRIGEVHLPALGRAMQWSDFGWLWRVWWLGDAMGAIVVAPFFIVWAKRREWLAPAQVFEAATLLVGLVVMTWLAFAGGWTAGLGHASLAYAIFPFVIWAAVRFGQHGTTAVTLLSSTLTIWATAQAQSLHAIAAHQQLLSLQIFLGVVAITGLLLGAALQERRRAENHITVLNSKLRRRVEELQALLDVLPVGIFIAHDASCEVITANPAGAAMLNIKTGINASKTGPGAEQLPFRVLKNGIEVPGEELPMQRAVRTGLPIAGEEFEIIRTDGTTVSLFEYAVPLFDDHGMVRGCLGAFVDITDRKRTEQAMREADRRKDEFLATLAHELRNPLAPIRNSLHILRLNEKLGGDDRQVCAMIERQVNHLVRLVDDLLEVSRISCGKIELRKQHITVGSIFKSAIETSRPFIEAAGHELIVTLPAESLVLEADAVRLSQVLANLLNNAAKYTDPGGRIWISARRDADNVLISVRDTGAGISSEMISRVFDLFFQAQRDKCGGGLGIGLTLVKRLVEMHGGKVTGCSQGTGLGSEFVVQLPLAEMDAAVVTLDNYACHEAAPMTVSPRVLIVDDNCDAADSLAMLLRLQGADVVVAYSGLTALDALADHRPQLIFLDLGMPEMDGYEVARRIRRRPEFMTVPVVALTGWGQTEDRQRSAGAGFDYHLLKPVNLQELGTILSSISVNEGVANGRKAVGANV